VGLDKFNRLGCIDGVVLVFVRFDEIGKDIEAHTIGTERIGRVIEILADLCNGPCEVIIVSDGADVVHYTVSGLIWSYYL
jgi:hypothetical protein